MVSYALLISLSVSLTSHGILFPDNCDEAFGVIGEQRGMHGEDCNLNFFSKRSSDAAFFMASTFYTLQSSEYPESHPLLRHFFRNTASKNSI